MTDLRLHAKRSWQQAAFVGSGPSQFQWIVSKVTSFTQVLSNNLILKIRSRKLHCSRVIFGWSQVAIRDS